MFSILFAVFMLFAPCAIGLFAVRFLAFHLARFMHNRRRRARRAARA